MPDSGITAEQTWQSRVVPDSLPEGEAASRPTTPMADRTTNNAAYTAEEEALVEERLKNLGYL
jgi:hypothetical protein